MSNQPLYFSNLVPQKKASVYVKPLSRRPVLNAPAHLLLELKKLEEVRFTGTAHDWWAEVEYSDYRVNLSLHWHTFDRERSDRTIELVFSQSAEWEDFERASPISWLHSALRFVFQHEADETIVLGDGSRPFDPHMPNGELRSVPIR